MQAFHIKLNETIYIGKIIQIINIELIYSYVSRLV